MADEKKPDNIFGSVVQYFKDAANWVQENLGDPALAEATRADLGLKPGQDIAPAKKDQFAQFGQGLDPDKAAFDETLAEIKDVIPMFKALGDELKDGSLSGWDVAFLLIRLAAVQSLQQRVPLAYTIAQALLLVTDEPDDVELFNVDMLVRLLRGDGFPPGSAERILGKLTPSLVLGLVEQLVLDGHLPREMFDFYFGWDPAPGTTTPIADDVATGAGTLLMRYPRATGASINWALTMMHVRPEHGGRGLFLGLNAGGELKTQVPETNFGVDLITSIPGQLNLFIPFSKTAHDFDVDASASNGFIRGQLTKGTQDDPLWRLGEKDKTRVDITQAVLGLDLAKERVSFRLGLKGAKLVINSSEGDSFLKNFLGEKSEIPFDFTLVFDRKNGFHIEGGQGSQTSTAEGTRMLAAAGDAAARDAAAGDAAAGDAAARDASPSSNSGMSTTIPIGKTLLNGLQVHQLHVQMGPGKNNHDLGLEVSGAFAVNIGPFKASIDRLGMRFDLSFKEGNLGFIDLDVGFKPPNGIGLVLDADIVKGGGFLFLDAERGEYAGVLELQFAKFGLKAIGILSTHMPDGSPGWSLLLLIYGQFYPPIQLSWGFTLNAVGGMIGLQHGVSIEALKDGLRTGALDDVLFPKNPVADAPRIINRLRTIFPPTPRALVFGPMFELGWGTPNILKIRLGLLFQLDNALGNGRGENRPASLKKIILLGQLNVRIPTPVKPDTPAILKLIVDFFGYYDFSEQRLEFMARLRDSTVMGLALSGMLYVRADFGAADPGSRPNFILAAGGFHPKFLDLPAGVPAPIDRIKLSFNIGIVKISAESYFAITAATVQFGADIQIAAKVGPVELSGYLGFDVICFLEPRFYFEADIRAGVKVKYKGHTLASVTLELRLEGPGRWRAKGKVTFSILWWDISKSFDESWGSTPTIAPTQTNVAVQLRAALADPQSWRAQLPLGDAPAVTLAFDKGETAILAHPLGQLQVMQQVAPLNFDLQRFGNTSISGPRRFDIDEVKVGTQVVASPAPAPAFFARSHFVDMTNEEKLSAPSFESFTAGVTVGTSQYRTAPSIVAADLDFETAYLRPEDPLRRTTRTQVVLGLGISAEMVQAQLHRGAAARSALRVQDRLQSKVNRKVKVETGA